MKSLATYLAEEMSAMGVPPGVVTELFKRARLRQEQDRIRSRATQEHRAAAAEGTRQANMDILIERGKRTNLVTSPIDVPFLEHKK